MLEDEDGINAFAAGFTLDDAVIGVTRGALDLLDRDELQGVVGHEFSHLLNGDRRLNVRLMGVLHGILVIGLIGYWILRSYRGGSSSGRGKKGGAGAVLLFGLALLVIGYVGVFFARLIKSAVSRQREFLADAASAQYTRDPLGARRRPAQDRRTRRGLAPRQPERRAGEPPVLRQRRRRALFPWLDTHPPLAERIRRLDPAWDGTFPQVEPRPRPARAAKEPAKPSLRAAREAAAAVGDAAARGRSGGGVGRQSDAGARRLRRRARATACPRPSSSACASRRARAPWSARCCSRASRWWSPRNWWRSPITPATRGCSRRCTR